MEKKDGFLSVVKGFIIGIGSLVPGISSSSIMISLSSYEEFIKSLVNPFKKKDKALFLITIPLIIGIIIGLLAGSHLVTYFLTNYKTQTIFLFVGLIAGGYMLIVRKERTKPTKPLIIIFLIIFLLSILCFIFTANNKILNIPDYLMPIFAGFITALSILIPALSASTFYILLDKYEYVINSLKTFSSISDFIIIAVFIISFLVGLVLISKLIYYFLQKHRIYTFVVISALLASSIVIALLEIGHFTINFVNIFTSILAFLWGYLLAKNIEKE